MLDLFQHVRAGQFEHGPNLFPRRAGKIIQDNFHRIPVAEVIEQALDRGACVEKDGFAPQPRQVYLRDLCEPAGFDLRILFQTQGHTHVHWPNPSSFSTLTFRHSVTGFTGSP